MGHAEHGSAPLAEQSRRLEGAAPVAGQHRRRLLQDVGLCSGLASSCLAAADVVSDPPAPTDAMGQVAAELAFIAYPGHDGLDSSCSGDCGGAGSPWEKYVAGALSQMGAGTPVFIYGETTSTRALAAHAGLSHDCSMHCTWFSAVCTELELPQHIPCLQRVMWLPQPTS